MGDDYPDDSQYDPAISACYDSMDWEAMKSNDAVEVWDPTGKAFGYVEGRMDKNRAAAYPNNGVLVIYVTDYVEQEGVHVGTVNVQDNWSNSVYIPSSDRLDLTKTHLSYTMVQMELDNDSAAAFAETARGSCAVWGWDSPDSQIFSVWGRNSAFLGAAVGTVLSLACAQTAWELVQEAASDTGSDYWYSNGNLFHGADSSVFPADFSRCVHGRGRGCLFALSSFLCLVYYCSYA